MRLKPSLPLFPHVALPPTIQTISVNASDMTIAYRA
jgi:hypothetical protein